jgi:DNA polymerase-1
MVTEWYLNKRDVYREIASKAYAKVAEEITDKERDNGKLWFLMTLYSAGPKKIALEQGIPYKEALAFYKQFHANLPQIRALSNPRPKSDAAMRHWEPGLIERAVKNKGYIVTPWGRHLHPEKFGEHKMMNKLIQGSAADMMKAALLRVDRWQRAQPDMESRMICTIHDSIMFDGPEEELPLLHANVPALMSDEPWLTEIVPITVDHEIYRRNWADKEAYE